mmetsp:Transcript_11991/g.25307  ORF Transcript_11991/g.25307 Transcript_11991/m.25307 type:complete len:219 (-) Transcript_11991:734-1390(-)
MRAYAYTTFLTHEGHSPPVTPSNKAIPHRMLDNLPDHLALLLHLSSCRKLHEHRKILESLPSHQCHSNRSDRHWRSRLISREQASLKWLDLLNHYHLLGVKALPRSLCTDLHELQIRRRLTWQNRVPWLEEHHQPALPIMFSWLPSILLRQRGDLEEVIHRTDPHGEHHLLLCPIFVNLQGLHPGHLLVLRRPQVTIHLCLHVCIHMKSNTFELLLTG